MRNLHIFMKALDVQALQFIYYKQGIAKVRKYHKVKLTTGEI